jgi:hypothetical protein
LPLKQTAFKSSENEVIPSNKSANIVSLEATNTRSRFVYPASKTNIKNNAPNQMSGTDKGANIVPARTTNTKPRVVYPASRTNNNNHAANQMTPIVKTAKIVPSRPSSISNQESLRVRSVHAGPEDDRDTKPPPKVPSHTTNWWQKGVSKPHEEPSHKLPDKDNEEWENTYVRYLQTAQTTTPENTHYELHGYRQSWFYEGHDGTEFGIYSEDSTLYYSGTLCGQIDTKCIISLPDGIYTWRVGGTLDEFKDYVSWSFYGMSGLSSNELTFTMERNKCYPIEEKSLAEICTEQNDYNSNFDFGASPVLLQGEIQLVGTQNATHEDSHVLTYITRPKYYDAIDVGAWPVVVLRSLA